MGAAHQAAFPVDYQQPGMTKREVIAMHVLAAMNAHPECLDWKKPDMAADAVQQADALLLELERTKP